MSPGKPTDDITQTQSFATYDRPVLPEDRLEAPGCLVLARITLGRIDDAVLRRRFIAEKRSCEDMSRLTFWCE